MSSTVSAAAQLALTEAMERLIAGRPLRSDGRLTVANLATEAGVSRASANRAAEVILEFRRAAVAIRAQQQVESVLRDPDRDRRRNAHILAQHAQALALQKRREEQRAASADVLPFKRKT